MYDTIELRQAEPSDARALLDIYAPYVRDTAVSFEYEVPSTEEFAARIRHTTERWPYLVARVDGVPLGYAYVSPFKTRAAYDWAVETTVYVRQDSRRLGLGGELYHALEECLRAQGVLNLNACIACPASEPDPFLTRDSLRFHEREGYRMVGQFHACGYKFDRWYDMVWMEKLIGEHRENQPPVRPFAESGYAFAVGRTLRR